MSENETGREAKEALAAVRLRRPERRQMDLVGTTHPVRTVAAVVAKLDLSDFREPNKAREAVAGRDQPGAAGVAVVARSMWRKYGGRSRSRRSWQPCR